LSEWLYVTINVIRPWRRDRLPTPCFPGGSDSKESTCNVGDLGSIPGLERCRGVGPDNSLQYSCLENPHRQRSLAGYNPWSCKESDMTEQLSTHTYTHTHTHTHTHTPGTCFLSRRISEVGSNNIFKCFKDWYLKL